MTTRFVARAGFVLALLLATPLFAVAAEGGEKTNVLEPSTITSLVTLVVFGALLAILYKAAWGPILKGLQTREHNEQKKLDDTAKARDEAQALRVQLQAELAKASDEVRRMLDDARKDAEALRTREREIGVKEAADERERAKRDIEAARDAALEQIYRQAVDLATTLSAKTIARQITADDHRQLLQESLVELGQAGKKTTA